MWLAAAGVAGVATFALGGSAVAAQSKLAPTRLSLTIDFAGDPVADDVADAQLRPEVSGDVSVTKS